MMVVLVVMVGGNKKIEGGGLRTEGRTKGKGDIIVKEGRGWRGRQKGRKGKERKGRKEGTIKGTNKGTNKPWSFSYLVALECSRRALGPQLCCRSFGGAMHLPDFRRRCPLQARRSAAQW